ncbi:MAG: PCRF domain-containing protein [Candidatus Paceibacterota bacterium]
MDKIILEIRAGAGGEEAAIFAADLARAYQKFSAKQGWRFVILDYHQSSLNGYKSLVAEIAGEGVYDALKFESGVHRVQRIPATEKAGRVHTSTISVAVLKEVEQTQIQVNPSDLEVTFFRSSGPGGQNVNKVETAVRILHKPSGVVVASQVDRSQSANRDRAMNILRAKLFEFKQEEEQKKMGALRKEQIGSGDRSEKIRTYNFPQDRITDHRIGKKWHNIESIMDGNLEPIVKSFYKENDKVQ